MSRSWVEISLTRLAANVRVITRLLKPNTGLIAVLKANAYGHGLEPVARRLYETGVRSFAVALPEEGASLRTVAPEADILVLTGWCQGEEALFRQHDLRAAVFDERDPPDRVKVELKIDTGMTRLGVHWEEAARALERLGPSLVGVYSHFASSDTDAEYTRMQLERFLSATSGLKCRRHIANSAGVCYPEAHLDAVRPGLALYGISPDCPPLNALQPVLSWKTRVLTTRDVAEGVRVGYGGAWTARRQSRIAVLSVGYEDGYSRLLSNAGQVRLRGKLASIVGRVSMDLTTVDVTEVPEASRGDEATLIEADRESPLSVKAYADLIGTVPYEVLTSIGNRVRRVYLEDFEV
jgi:alanine racemase